MFVGNLNLPQDEGIAIGEAIVDGTCMGASDESLVRTYMQIKGSQGFVISSEVKDQEIEGWGPAPASNNMSSLTTENYGLLGLLIVLHMICKKFKINRDEYFDSVLVYIDNKTVVERGSMEQTLINLSDYAVPEQGLWTLTTELIKALPIEVTVKWVKGQQDKNSFGEKIMVHSNRTSNSIYELTNWQKKVCKQGKGK